MNVKQYVKERDEAFLSLDKEKIRAFCKKYFIHLPQNELVFWAGVHKAIIYINSATEDQKRKIFDWLTEHGFSPEIHYH